MSLEPIVIDCEGSAQPGCTEFQDQVMCAMCGHWWPVLKSINGRVVPYHQRHDLIAMIERGDFG